MEPRAKQGGRLGSPLTSGCSFITYGPRPRPNRASARNSGPCVETRVIFRHSWNGLRSQPHAPNKKYVSPTVLPTQVARCSLSCAMLALQGA
jgi:hypothetical protein